MKLHITKLLFAILSITTLAACRKASKQIAMQDFPVKKELVHEQINTPPILFQPVGLILLEDAVITLDLNADSLFQVFKRPSLDYLADFIRRGNGPNEETFIDPFIQPLLGNRFMYRNLTGIKIAEYKPENDTIEITDKINLPSELSDLFHTFKLKNSIIGTRSDMPTNKEFVAYDITTQEINDFGEEPPYVEYEFADKHKIQLFAKIVTVKPDETKFACVYDKFPILRIYSATGKLEHESQIQNSQDFPVALVKDNPLGSEIGNIMQNYRMIKSTNQFIYALYIGKTSKELSPGLNDFSNIIHVWDWNGQPIAQLILDNDIFSFDVSEDDKYIIACSLELLDGLYKYKIDIKQDHRYTMPEPPITTNR